MGTTCCMQIACKIWPASQRCRRHLAIRRISLVTKQQEVLPQTAAPHLPPAQRLEQPPHCERG